MYTGVIRRTGRIDAVTERADGASLRVSTPDLGLEPGDSVAVDGVCLTVAEVVQSGTAPEDDLGAGFTAFASTETVDCTALVDREGEPVNLETPVSTADALDGHLTKGTVDATATVQRVDRDGDTWTYHVGIPAGHAAHVAPKGAVALDGVSLTVDAVTDRASTSDASDDAGTFAAAVVPETRERTTLSRRDAGDVVHFEADVLARYAARASEVRS